MAAILLNRPYVAISEKESKQLAIALVNVAKQYKIEVNPAIMAWITLIGTSGAIYGPRIGVEFAARKAVIAAERQKRTLESAGTVSTQSMTAGPQPNAPAMNFAGT